MTIKTINFESFGEDRRGNLITSSGDVDIVVANNPYGTSNLVAVENGVAIAHGNAASILALRWDRPRNIKRRICRILSARPQLIDLIRSIGWV